MYMYVRYIISSVNAFDVSNTQPLVVSYHGQLRQDSYHKGDNLFITLISTVDDMTETSLNFIAL